MSRAQSAWRSLISFVNRTTKFMGKSRKRAPFSTKRQSVIATCYTGATKFGLCLGFTYSTLSLSRSELHLQWHWWLTHSHSDWVTDTDSEMRVTVRDVSHSHGQWQSHSLTVSESQSLASALSLTTQLSTHGIGWLSDSVNRIDSDSASVSVTVTVSLSVSVNQSFNQCESQFVSFRIGHRRYLGTHWLSHTYCQCECHCQASVSVSLSVTSQSMTHSVNPMTISYTVLYKYNLWV